MCMKNYQKYFVGLEIIFDSTAWVALQLDSSVTGWFKDNKFTPAVISDSTLLPFDML